MFSFDVSSNIVPTVTGNLEAASEKAVYAMAVQAQKDTSPYVPALTGDLDRRTKVEESKIIYPGPQSRYLYYGKLMIDRQQAAATHLTEQQKFSLIKTWFSTKLCTRRRNHIGLRRAKRKTRANGNEYLERR